MREYSLGTLIDIDATLTPAHVALLSAAGTPLRRRAGERIYGQGEPAAHVDFLLRGEARSLLVGRGGDETLLRLHLPHSLMGLTALGSRPVRDADARASIDCELVRIPRAAFLALLDAHPDLARRVIALLVDRMSDFHHRVGDFAGLGVEQRLARALLSLSRPDPQARMQGGPDGVIDGDRRPVRMTHQELATLTNARRPTVTAALRRLAEGGCIAQEGRAVVVRDAAALAAIAEPD